MKNNNLCIIRLDLKLQNFRTSKLLRNFRTLFKIKSVEIHWQIIIMKLLGGILKLFIYLPLISSLLKKRFWRNFIENIRIYYKCKELMIQIKNRKRKEENFRRIWKFNKLNYYFLIITIKYSLYLSWFLIILIFL